MSSSLTPKQVAEQELREKAELEGRVQYLQDKLGKLIRERSRSLRRSSSTSGACGDGPEVYCLSLVANFHFGRRYDLI